MSDKITKINYKRELRLLRDKLGAKTTRHLHYFRDQLSEEENLSLDKLIKQHGIPSNKDGIKKIQNKRKRKLIRKLNRIKVSFKQAKNDWKITKEEWLKQK